MDCPECGAHNPEDAEYCNLCFQKFGEPELSVEAPAGREAIDVTSVDVPVSPGTHIDPEIPGMAGAGAAAAVAAPLGTTETPAGALEKPKAAMKPEDTPAIPMSAETPANEIVIPTVAALADEAEAAKDPGGAEEQSAVAQPAAADLPPGAYIKPRQSSGALRRWLIISLAAIVLVVGVWILVSRLTHGTTFKSEMGTLSFRYPSSWKQVEPGEISSLTGVNMSTLQPQAELTVKAGGTEEGGPTYVLSVSSQPNNFTNSWSKVKEQFKQRFLSTLSNAAAGAGPSGVSFSKGTYKEIKVGEDPAYSMKIQVKDKDGSAEIEQILLVHEESAYVFTFYTRKPDGVSHTVGDILNTVKFEITKPPAEEPV